MLKRLFISLIILSALTTDASAFSAYMLSAGLSPEVWLNRLEDSKIMPETAAGNIYIASSDEIIQSRTIQFRLDFVMPENTSISSEISCLREAGADSVKAESREVIFGSDTSPPTC